MEELDLSEELKKYFHNNQKTFDYIKSKSEIQKVLKKWMSISPLWVNKEQWTKCIPIEEVVLGLSINLFGVIVGKHKLIIFNNKVNKTLSFNDFNKIKFEDKGRFGSMVLFDGDKLFKLSEKSGSNITNIKTLFDKTYDIVILKLEEQIRLQEEQIKLQEEQIRLQEEQIRLQEKQRLKELQVSQTNVLSELDKDGNGEIDVIEGNDFNTLLKKHQKSIVEVDRNYVQQFVKVSSYLKTKKGNIQTIFNSIKDTPNQEVLNEYVEILKDEIHTYNLILFNSLNMIVSLVEDDMITFYEIHEMFDTINMFDSKHEKDVSQKLTNIGDGLESLMYQIRDMGNQISNSIQELSYVTEESNQQLNEQLSEIDSTMKAGNLINAINTYQNYKINKNTKSLDE